MFIYIYNYIREWLFILFSLFLSTRALFVFEKTAFAYIPVRYV